MFIWLIICLCVICLCLYVIFNLYRKLTEIEDIAIQNQQFYDALRNRVLSHQTYLRQLDQRGSFESDDEVGYFFKELKKIVNDISYYIDFGEEPQEDIEDYNPIREKLSRQNSVGSISSIR